MSAKKKETKPAFPYEWAGCPTAKPGEEHFPCNRCTWERKK